MLTCKKPRIEVGDNEVAMSDLDDFFKATKANGFLYHPVCDYQSQLRSIRRFQLTHSADMKIFLAGIVITQISALDLGAGGCASTVNGSLIGL